MQQRLLRTRRSSIHRQSPAIASAGRSDGVVLPEVRADAAAVGETPGSATIEGAPSMPPAMLPALRPCRFHTRIDRGTIGMGHAPRRRERWLDRRGKVDLIVVEHLEGRVMARCG